VQPTEACAVVFQCDHRRLDDVDAERLEARELSGDEIVRTVAEENDVVGPLAQQNGEVLSAGAGGEDRETFVAMLEAVE
jgi:hypothetical protein